VIDNIEQAKNRFTAAAGGNCMNTTVSTTKNKRWSLLCLVTLLLLLEACGGNNTRTNAIPAVATVATANPATSTVPPIPATPTIHLLPEAMTKLAEMQTVEPAAYATFYAAEVAREQRMLTPHPSSTPQPTPLPITATPQLGLWTDCGHGLHDDPLAANCWQLFIHGILYQVTAGRLAPESEADQGVLWVRGPGDHVQDVPWYRTPQRVGSIHIVTVEGLRVTVANRSPPNPPASFVFDLATRQWLHPDGTPWPTPTPLPTMPP
jgi:hypothetical protein